MWLTFWTLSSLLLLSDGRSSGSRSSPSRPRTPSSSSYPRQPTSSGSSYPSRQTSAPSNSWNRPSAPSPPVQHYGWNTPKTNTVPKPPASSNYGWTVPKTESVPKPPASNYGWSAPKTESVPKPPSYGWTAPKPRPPTSYNNPGPTSAPGWQNPRVTPAAPHSWTQKPFYNPTQQKAFDNSYVKGYDRGFQQATRINHAYYPQQSPFGYPAQGFAHGNHAPTYGGMSVFGSPHNYGYPVSSSYGYNTYGSGGSGLTKGILIGAVGGYLLNSAVSSLHSRTVHSTQRDGWGYQSGGYGSDYPYTRTTINNYFNDPKPQDDSNHHVPDNWVHCIAFDPMTETTLTNPNCSCSVTFETDPTTNTTTANHHCTTQSGSHQIQKTPASDVEILDMIRSNKLQYSDELQKQRVFEQLNNIFTMGSFTA